jgi:hypothetical protein
MKNINHKKISTIKNHNYTIGESADVERLEME